MPATLYALIGPPGAGKTSLRRCFPGAVVVSLDELRAELSCCDMNQDPELRDVVVCTAMARAAAALGNPESWRGILPFDEVTRDVLWDATNARAEHRRALVQHAHDRRARAVGILVLPPLDVVLTRNGARDTTPCPSCGLARRVPEDIVAGMHAAIVADLPTLADEGWDEIRAGAGADCPGVLR